MAETKHSPGPWRLHKEWAIYAARYGRKALARRERVVDPLTDPNAAHREELRREHTADVLGWYR